MAETAASFSVTSADGTTIAYERHGDGAPVVLIGGAFNDRSTIRDLAVALAPHFSVIGYDRRGRGDSSDTPPYAPDREIDDLEAVIAAVGGAAGVFGHSSGAALAVKAAVRSAAISKLAVYEPPYRADGYDGLGDQLAAAVAEGDRTAAVRRFLTEGVGVPEEYLPAIEGSPDWPAMLAIAHTLPYDLSVLGDGAVPAAAGAIDVPTIVISGGASDAWFQTAASQLAAAIPDAQQLTIDGEDHSVLDRPGVLVPYLVDFFG